MKWLCTKPLRLQGIFWREGEEYELTLADIRAHQAKDREFLGYFKPADNAAQALVDAANRDLPKKGE